METTTSLMSCVQQQQQRRTVLPSKRTKPKKKTNKPIKVVYISNPMKVKTCASNFRALVQELTGQDAESPPDPSRFEDPDGGGGWHQMKKIGNDDVENDDLVVAPIVDPNNNSSYQGDQQGSSSFEESSFDPFDDIFTPQMVENISALLPASLFYESQW